MGKCENIQGGTLLNRNEVSEEAFKAFVCSLQGSTGRDLAPFTNDGKIRHGELLKVLDLNGDGYFGPEDTDLFPEIFGKESDRMIKDLKDFGFDVEEEAQFHLQEKKEIELLLQKFPIGSRVKRAWWYSSESFQIWPAGKMDEVSVGRVVGKPNDPPCESEDFFGPHSNGIQIPVVFDNEEETSCVDADDNKVYDYEFTSGLMPAAETDKSSKHSSVTYFSTRFIGWAPLIEYSTLDPVGSHPDDPYVDGAGSLKAGVAFYYPKYSKVAAFGLLGGQVGRKTYVYEDATEEGKGFGGGLFGIGLSVGHEWTLDPYLTVSPVWSFDNGNFNLVLGGGIHTTILGLIGLHAGCEIHSSETFCGGGVGVTFSLRSDSVTLGATQPPPRSGP